VSRLLRIPILGVLLAVGAALPAPGAHPHYERLLDRGTYALEQGAFDEAARHLRLACFGLLDEPETLAVCLTRLGRAQAATGDDEGFRETFRRLAEVEERFGAYGDAPLDPGARAAFEAEVAARIPATILETTPPFARLAGGGGAAPPPAPLPAPTPAVQTLPEQPPDDPPAEPVPAPEAPPQPAPPAPRPSLSPQDRGILTRAHELLQAAKTRQDLDEPYRLAAEVADANPAVRGPQHLAAVIAYRAARWQDAVRYFRRGGDPGEDDAETLFYMAVSLYEAGEPAAAADALRRSLPRIEHTAFVRSYEAKILGEASEASEPGATP
jgi:tetratricopeptide (TPR) repeat protein